MSDLKLSRRLVTQIESDKIHLKAIRTEVKRVRNFIVVQFVFSGTSVVVEKVYSNFGMILEGAVA